MACPSLNNNLDSRLFEYRHEIRMWWPSSAIYYVNSSGCSKYQPVCKFLTSSSHQFSFDQCEELVTFNAKKKGGGGGGGYILVLSGCR